MDSVYQHRRTKDGRSVQAPPDRCVPMVHPGSSGVDGSVRGRDGDRYSSESTESTESILRFTQTTAEEISAPIKCSADEVVQSAALFWWLRHPITTKCPANPLACTRAVVSILRSAPRLEPRLTHSPGGRHIATYLRETRFGVRRRLWAKSVLEIAPEGQPLFAGRAMQAARTNMRRAQAEGLSCTEVSAAAPELGTRKFRLWDKDGAEIGGANLVVDQEWALMNNLWAHSGVGYYLVHGHVVEEMQRARVRYILMNAENAIILKPGLLYMQGRLGYQVVHLRLGSTA